MYMQLHQCYCTLGPRLGLDHVYMRTEAAFLCGGATGVSDIKQRYRELCVSVHPDKNKHPRAADAFAALHAAFKTATCAFVKLRAASDSAAAAAGASGLDGSGGMGGSGPEFRAEDDPDYMMEQDGTIRIPARAKKPQAPGQIITAADGTVILAPTPISIAMNSRGRVSYDAIELPFELVAQLTGGMQTWPLLPGAMGGAYGCCFTVMFCYIIIYLVTKPVPFLPSFSSLASCDLTCAVLLHMYISLVLQVKSTSTTCC